MSALTALTLALALTFGGSALAWWIQRAGGDVRVLDIRFADERGKLMSALLYVPDDATEAQPAPGILAVHGYINSRETQSGFAIELARRGYVVLALDQTGHGYSEPPAFAAGFGGPAGLEYLRSLAFVDTDNVGLEGHSMGGWAVLAAAAAHPDGYRSMVLEGSTTGMFGAPAGTTEFPRNVAVVFSAWDEFAELMWGVPRGTEVGRADKLKALFGTTDDVVEGRLYGDMNTGTARVLHVPMTTHPGDHLSTAAIGDAIDWFARSLAGGRQVDGQIWYWKEIGTLAGLVGFVLALLASARLVLDRPAPRNPTSTFDWPRRRTTALLLAFVPVITYFPAFVLAERLLPPTTIWPQQITNGLMLWALINGAVTALAIASTDGWRPLARGLTWGDGFYPQRVVDAFFAALLIVAAGYATLLAVDLLFDVDFRFWVVAVKPLAPWHAPMVLAYFPVLAAFFVLLGAAAAPLMHEDGGKTALPLAGILSSGFVMLLLLQYVPLLAGWTLPLGQPLHTIIAFQFVALLAIVGLVTAVCYRITGTVYAGAFVNALLITWVVVAGQATQAG